MHIILANALQPRASAAVLEPTYLGKRSGLLLNSCKYIALNFESFIRFGKHWP